MNDNSKAIKNTRPPALEQFITKLSWKIYNKEFKELRDFEFSNFRFKFILKKQEQMERFVEFLKEHNPLLPWDMCNFLLKENVKFDLEYRYVKGAGVKTNFILFKTYLYLKKELKKLSM